MKFFSWFRRRKFDDDAKVKLAEWVASTLLIQIRLAGVRTDQLASEKGAKALGYVYGWVDAVLQARGENMSDMSVGVPVTWHVLRRVFPGCEDSYIDFIADQMESNKRMASGMMLGGQQCIDWLKNKLPAPMGLAELLLALGGNE